MGRWLAALEKRENAPEAHLQNPQKYPEPIFEGFEGSRSGDIANFFGDARPVLRVLRVLRVPLSGENENFSADPAAFEERAAFLEYDCGLQREDAKRQAAAETGYALPKSDAEVYADALRLIEPCGYGPVAIFLGWGAARAANAEDVLRKAGRIVYDATGRGKLSTPRETE